jgi:hypothetical protein
VSDDVTNPVSGRAFIEFSLELPSQLQIASKQLLPLENCKIVETVFGSGEADIAFRVTTADFLDKILKALGANGNPLIKWRVGLGGTGTITWLPWQLHYFLHYTAQFEGVGPTTGHFIRLLTRDLLHLIDRASKTRAHHGSTSAIVINLAKLNGLLETVVEASQGVGVWIQSYEGDIEFIRKRLLARSRSTRGRGNYYLFMRDNVLHFHTVEYNTAIKSLNYCLSPATRLEAVNVAQGKIGAGAAGVRVIYHDPYSCLCKKIDSDPNKAIRMANSLPRLDKIAGAARNILEHRTPSRDEEAGSTALAQNTYEFARSECFQMKLLTSMATILRPGELLDITIDPSAKSTSTWSGLYLIAKAEHTIDKGEINSVYILQRGEQRVARNSSASAFGSINLQDEQVAPGYDINVREAQSSAATKGAGKATSGGVYLRVQDKNAAPDTPLDTSSIIKAATS